MKRTKILKKNDKQLKKNANDWKFERTVAPPRIADPRKNKRAETLIADFLPAYLFTGPETNENNAAIPIVRFHCVLTGP